MVAKTASEERWVWLDLEMTGLDPDTCVIIEAAAIITDGDLNELGSMSQVVWQPDSALETMGPFVRKMHTDNGLLEAVRASNKSLADVERDLMTLLTTHVGYRRGVLAGNSVWQDRRFLERFMPNVEGYLHYRQIDVSSFKVVASQWYGSAGEAPKAKSNHTALADIRASIEELRWYRDNAMHAPGEPV